ncbi:MAG: translation elongation factor Ts [bacterium]
MENIKKLRDITGAGMMDCKKALEEAGNDLDKAIDVLRKSGIAKAAKRSNRETSQGIIKLALSDDNKEGYMVELNAETDFVVRNEKFQEFGDKVLELIKKEKPADCEALLSLPFNSGTVASELELLSGIIGEKLAIKRCAVLSSDGTVSAYTHANGAIGVLVALDKPDQADLARDIAMHIAAANPDYILPDEVPAEEIEKEKEVYREQLAKEGKPENIIENILQGKINKYFEGVCLVKQEYIKDDKQKVEQVLGDVKVEKFIRFSLQ